MSRQLEAWSEEKTKRQHIRVHHAVEGGLEEAIQRAGGELVGLSMKCNPGDCLMTVRVLLAGRRQICFVGGDSIGNCFLKAVREAGSDQLNWRDDKFQP